MTMKMKANKRAYSASTWQLFLLKYLILLPENRLLETEFCFYPKVYRPLRYLLDLFSRSNIKISKTGLSLDFATRDRYANLLEDLEKYDPQLSEQATKNKLTLKDLRRLSNLSKQTAKALVQNLTLKIDFQNNKPKLVKTLESEIQKYIKGISYEAEQNYHQHYYSYDYQKTNFLKNIDLRIQKFGRKQTLRQSGDSSLLGKSRIKISFLETILALELEGFATISHLELQDWESYKHKETDLVVVLKITDKALKTIPKLMKSGIVGKQSVLTYGNLKYSLSKCELSYKNQKPILISPEKREMKFFLSLYNKGGRVVEYKDIAKDADLESYKYLNKTCETPHEEIKNSDLSADVAMLKRDFRTIVLSLGMPKAEFNKLITTVSKRGYMLP